MLRVSHSDIVFVSILLVGVCCLPAPSMPQGVEAWWKLGLYGGQICDIAIDPANPEKMFVGNYTESHSCQNRLSRHRQKGIGKRR